jgi:hypothetical protein
MSLEQRNARVLLKLLSSVADRFDADPDPNRSDADTDPNWHQNDADPHVDLIPCFTHVAKI